MVIVERYNYLVEICEFNYVLMGIIILLININLVVNYCMVDVVMLKFFINVGKVVVKIVWLRMV